MASRVESIPESQSARRSSPCISVVVPTYHAKVGLEECLASIRRQKKGPTEVIIVDKFTKAIEHVARAFGAKIVRTEAGMAEARNIGLRQSSGDFLLSLDADMQLEEGLLDECVHIISQGFDALIIPEVTFGTGFWAICRTAERNLSMGNSNVESPRFFKRNVLLEVGGYDSDLLFGEDMDLTLRLRRNGYRIGRCTNRIWHNEGQLSLGSHLLKKYHYAKSARMFAKKYGSKDLVVIYGPSRFFRHETIDLLIRRPKIFLGIMFMKISEYAIFVVGFVLGRD